MKHRLYPAPLMVAALAQFMPAAQATPQEPRVRMALTALTDFDEIIFTNILKQAREFYVGRTSSTNYYPEYYSDSVPAALLDEDTGYPTGMPPSTDDCGPWEYRTLMALTGNAPEDHYYLAWDGEATVALTFTSTHLVSNTTSVPGYNAPLADLPPWKVGEREQTFWYSTLDPSQTDWPGNAGESFAKSNSFPVPVPNMATRNHRVFEYSPRGGGVVVEYGATIEIRIVEIGEGFGGLRLVRQKRNADGSPIPMTTPPDTVVGADETIADYFKELWSPYVAGLRGMECQRINGAGLWSGVPNSVVSWWEDPAAPVGEKGRPKEWWTENDSQLGSWPIPVLFWNPVQAPSGVTPASVTPRLGDRIELISADRMGVFDSAGNFTETGSLPGGVTNSNCWVVNADDSLSPHVLINGNFVEGSFNPGYPNQVSSIATEWKARIYRRTDETAPCGGRGGGSNPCCPVIDEGSSDLWDGWVLVAEADLAAATNPTVHPQRGCAIETLIDIYNEMGVTEAWFCIPHQASDDYVTEMADEVRSSLSPTVTKIYVEYSNETWNNGFTQHLYCQAEGAALAFADPDNVAAGATFPTGDAYFHCGNHYYGVRAQEAMALFQSRFVGEESRVNRVLAGQNLDQSQGSEFLASLRTGLRAPKYNPNPVDPMDPLSPPIGWEFPFESETCLPTGSVTAPKIDAEWWSHAPYFNSTLGIFGGTCPNEGYPDDPGGVGFLQATYDQLLAAIDDALMGNNGELAANLDFVAAVSATGGVPGGFPPHCEQQPLGLVCYEGGQHLVSTQYCDQFGAFQNTSQMGDLYDHYLGLLELQGVDCFLHNTGNTYSTCEQYGDECTKNAHGWFGAYSSIYDAYLTYIDPPPVGSPPTVTLDGPIPPQPKYDAIINF